MPYNTFWLANSQSRNHFRMTDNILQLKSQMRNHKSHWCFSNTNTNTNKNKNTSTNTNTNTNQKWEITLMSLRSLLLHSARNNKREMSFLLWMHLTFVTCCHASLVKKRKKGIVLFSGYIFTEDDCVSSPPCSYQLMLRENNNIWYISISLPNISILVFSYLWQYPMKDFKEQSVHVLRTCVRYEMQVLYFKDNGRIQLVEKGQYWHHPESLFDF